MLKRTMGLCAALLLAAATAAMGVADETVTVMGRGTGTDRTKALEAAYQDAIERAVGLYVDAEQLMENQKLVKDQILTHSNAYIERYDVKKETDLGRGLTEIQILATVKKSALTRKIKDVMPAGIFPIKGTGNIHAKTTTTQKRDKDAVALVRNALKGVNPITQMMRVAPAGSKLTAKEITPPHGRKKTMYSLPVRVTLDQEKYFGHFLPSLLAVFDQIAIDPPKTLYFNKLEEKPRLLRGTFINAVALGNDEYKIGWYWNNRPYDSDIDEFLQYYNRDSHPFKEAMKKQGCFHAVLITEMNADRTVVTAKHYRLPLACMPVLVKWYKGLADNGQVTRYRAAILDGNGSETAATSFVIPNRAVLNCSVGPSRSAFGLPRKGAERNYGFYLAPLVSLKAEACELRVWFDISVEKLPDVQSVKIELAE